ncbi:aromatic-ring-hydroxylating dioxygenase subunit beta [Sphingomonas sp. ERG5]|uniref:aromatic-ring-hydroxylating dioxygenase subunit beta n=1 Tax=Sphingomonas sp. ERG5 TaxID=1381597 RepID=UPI00054B4C29|nr:aromatic-ring-hydroxylating dioxygenase subunit beta [Sphingomonas sp. ERG5]
MSADIDRIVEFIWREADLLDQMDFAAWLSLWDDAGLYIVPIDRGQTDYANCLNYAYDDAAMRRMRVARLTSGESVSAAAAGVTVRTVSRFRRLEDGPQGEIRMRCAQHLFEFRNGNQRLYAADVSYSLLPAGSDFKLLEKVVLLVNSTDALAGITFLP